MPKHSSHLGANSSLDMILSSFAAYYFLYLSSCILIKEWANMPSIREPSSSSLLSSSSSSSSLVGLSYFPCRLASAYSGPPLKNLNNENSTPFTSMMV